MVKPPLLVALLSCLLLSACKNDKEQKVVLTVHAQGSDMDSPKTVFRKPVAGRIVILKTIAEFTTLSVAAFHPFPADDGTYGVTFKLDFKGSNALELVTRMRRGEMLVSMVNGAVVDYVTIDRPITDGIFTVWSGFTEEMVAYLDEKYPRIKDLSSSSTFLEMTPSTPKEKRESRRRAKEAAEEAAEKSRRKARGEFDPEEPEGDLVPLSELLKNSR